MNIRILTFDEDGLSRGEMSLPPKTISVTIVDGDREITYDPETYAVALEEDGKQVKDFSDDQTELEVAKQAN